MDRRKELRLTAVIALGVLGLIGAGTFATFTAQVTRDRVSFHALINAYWEALEFELPPVSDSGRRPWRRWIDTFLDSPHDIIAWEHAPLVPGQTYRAEPRSVVVLFAGLEADGGR